MDRERQVWSGWVDELAKTDQEIMTEGNTRTRVCTQTVEALISKVQELRSDAASNP